MVGIMVSWWCHDGHGGVKVVSWWAWWCHGGVMVMSRWCHGGHGVVMVGMVSMVLPWWA